MMKIALAPIMVIVANVAMAATSANQLGAVDPLIGTGQTVDGVASCEKGATMPYVGVPFGSVMWVPMTRESQFGTLAFNQQDTKLLGFAASRQMAVAMGEWGEFSFLPTMGTGAPLTDFAVRGQTISAKSFTPYSGAVSAGGIKTDYTATAHAAIYKITFPGHVTRQPQIVFDASRDDMFRRFPNTATNQLGGLTILDGGQTVVAWNTDNTDWYRSKPMPGYRARFRMEFSEKPVGFATYRHVVTRDGTNTVTEAGATSVEADACGATFTFAQSPQVRTIFVKCSVSLVSDENLKSLMDEEIVAWDFDGTLNETQAAWNEKFSLLKFSSGDSDVTKTLATAIYHALQWPRDVTEFGRHYSPATDEVRDGVMFTGQSMWDTYRAENALLGFLAPDRIGDMMKSLVNIADESGYLPLYPNPGETSCMVGAPGEVQLAEAVQKGWLTGTDAEAAYAAAKRNATVPSAKDGVVKWRDQEWWTGSVEGRGGLTTYRTLGYVACDRTCQSVSRTQDFSHADDAMARFAAFLGKDADAAFFAARSHSWTNLWKRDERNVAPRNAAGAWVKPEDCILDGNPYDGAYSESGAAQARWAVPHDLATLVGLLGGTDAAVRELDAYEASVTRAKDGLVLHDDHSNEPAHHIPYLYNLLGSHDACAKTVREIMADYYPSSRQWRRGHDDCGQMSAWYVFSALGFYPVNPADLTYRIGSPLVDEATLDVGDGKTFRITVNNQAKNNVYVKSVKLNGVELADRTFTHAQVMAGGDLVFEMSDAPVIQKKPISYIDADGVMQTKFSGEYDVVTAETAVFGDGWYVVTGEVLRAGIDVAAGCTANLIICDGASLTVSGDTSCAGIDVRPGETLNIYGQANGTGRLVAKGGSGSGNAGGAGIGGGYQTDGGTVTICGGSVTAEGGEGAYGIGGSKIELCENMIMFDITDGEPGVEVTSGNYFNIKKSFTTPRPEPVVETLGPGWYVTATNGVYIGTRFKPDSNTRVEMDVEVGDAQEYWFGCWDGNWDNGAFALGNDVNNEVYCGYGSGRTTCGGISGLIPPGRVTVALEKGVVYTNGVVWSAAHADSSTVFALNYNLYLFAQNRKGTAYPGWEQQRIVCYGCKIWTNGMNGATLVRNFVPARTKDEQQIVGLYDTVSGKFFAPCGGSLTLGHDENADPTCEGGTIAWSDAANAWVVTPNEGVTEVAVTGLPEGATVAVPPSVTKVSGVADAQIKVRSGAYDITGAFTVSGGEIALNPNGVVTIGGETIPVKPTIGELGYFDGEPFAVGENGASITIRTIPGLFYGFRKCSSLSLSDGEFAVLVWAKAERTNLSFTDKSQPEQAAFYDIEVRACVAEPIPSDGGFEIKSETDPEILTIVGLNVDAANNRVLLKVGAETTANVDSSGAGVLYLKVKRGAEVTVKIECADTPVGPWNELSGVVGTVTVDRAGADIEVKLDGELPAQGYFRAKIVE